MWINSTLSCNAFLPLIYLYKSWHQAGTSLITLLGTDSRIFYHETQVLTLHKTIRTAVSVVQRVHVKAISYAISNVSMIKGTSGNCSENLLSAFYIRDSVCGRQETHGNWNIHVPYGNTMIKRYGLLSSFIVMNCPRVSTYAMTCMFYVTFFNQ